MTQITPAAPSAALSLPAQGALMLLRFIIDIECRGKKRGGKEEDSVR